MRVRNWFVLIAALAAVAGMVTNVWAADIYVPGDYTTIQDAINAASAGDVIHVAAGTYTEALNVNKSVSIIGDQTNPGNVVLQATSGVGFGSPVSEVFVSANNVSLKGMTLVGLGQGTSATPRYGIKFGAVSGGLVEDLIIYDFSRAGLEFHTCTNVIVTDLNAYNNGGTGLVLRNVDGATVTNLTTNNNLWGGTRIQSDPAYTTDHIVFAGTNSFGENAGRNGGLYTEEDPPGNPITYGYTGASEVQLQAADYAFALHGTQDDNKPRVRFYQTLAQAVAAATVPPLGDHLVAGTGAIKNIATGHWIVVPGMSIQAAINAASAGDVVEVATGYYQESMASWKDLEITKSLSLIGAGSGATVIGLNQTATNGMEIRGAGLTVLLEGLTFTKRPGNPAASGFNLRIGETTSSFTNITLRDVEVAYAAARNVFFDGNATYTSIVVENCNIHHSGAWGMSVRGVVSSLTCAGSNFEHNGTTDPAHGIGFDVDMPINISGLQVTGGSFSHNLSKGINLVKTNNAVFTGITANNNGGAPGGGFGVCLWEWSSSSSNLSFSNCVINNNSLDGFLFGTEGGCTINGVTISHSTVTGNGRDGILLYQYLSGSATNVSVFDCDVSGNTNKSINSNFPEMVNASGNWWGSHDPAIVGARRSSNVDYTPWLNVGTDMSGTPGFQGDFSTLWVDDNSPQTGSVGRVQEGVNMVVGSTVNLAAGTYEEQVHITTNNLNLVGAGVGSTIIQSPTSLPLYFMTSNQNHPIVFVDGATGVNISNLTVDGLGRGNSNYRFSGIAYWNAGGALNSLRITNIKDTPFSGAQHGVCVYAYNNTSGPYTLNITDVDVDNYQKNGFALNGNGNLTVNLNDVSATGIGATTITAQNGIQVWGGSGTLTNCATTGNAWIWTSGTHWASAGYLFIQAAVNASGCTSTDNQIALDYDDASGSISGGMIIGDNATPDYSAGVVVANWSAAVSGTRPRTQPLPDPITISGSNGSARLDGPGDETVSISNVTMTGEGAVNSYGVDAYNDAGDMNLSVNGCTITNWENGVVVYRNGGTISAASVTGCKLANTAYNAYDNVAGHTWNLNCYSDFASNPGHPAQYNIPGGGGNVDNNPNPNGCSNVDIVITDPNLGCTGTCANGYFYLTLDQAGLLNLEVIVQLPTGITLNLGGNPDVRPPSGGDPRLQFAQAQSWGTNQVKINMMWDQTLGGSSGNPAHYVSRIPISTAGAATGTYTVAGVSSLWFEEGGTQHENELMLGSNDFIVDCTVPPAPTTFVNNGTCAYGPGYKPADIFAITGLTSGGGSALESAWITFNGNASPTFPLTLAGSDPYNITFPASGDVSTFYTYLSALEGCNTLNLHVKDVECNESVFDLTNVGWDATAPAISGVPASPTRIYGPTTYLYLDDDLTILPDLTTGQPCRATSGTLKVWYNIDPDTFFLSLPLTNEWPYDDTEATTFWTWIITLSGVPNTANGEDYVFGVKACDCAGNCYASTITLKIDISKPANVVTGFDARPAHLGVWLKWSWTAGADAQKMEVWRSVKDVGEYPNYPNAKWNNPANYPVSYGTSGPAGFELVCTQTAMTGTVTSADLTDNNNRGDFHQHVSGSYTYWLDARTGWVDGDGNAPAIRDIYRYVTFVQDAGGNWSEVSSYTMGTNADRSTNYWLGDFATADAGGPVDSRGYVDGDDLGVLSTFYFTNAGNFCNIGPVKTPVENGSMGKSIPWPTGPAIDFYDLVPFSFNYGAVGPVTGGAGEFVVDLPPVDNRLFGRMDALPVISLQRVGEEPISAGQTFTVVVSLSGNIHQVVKAAEAEIEFSEGALELVSATPTEVAVSDGILFNKVAPVADRTGIIGVVAAALGETAALTSDAPLAVLTFRWKSDDVKAAEIRLPVTRLADGSGATVEVEGSALIIRTPTVMPTEYALYQNYPNPFNPTTTIAFDLKESGFVRLNVFNLLGQQVAVVADRMMEAGHHTVTFDASSLPSGMYVYRIEVNGFTAQNKLLLMR